MIPTIPPMGRAIKGSIAILNKGLSAKSNIAIKGPIMEAKKFGFPSEDIESSFSLTKEPYLLIF